MSGNNGNAVQLRFNLKKIALIVTIFGVLGPATGYGWGIWITHWRQPTANAAELERQAETDKQLADVVNRLTKIQEREEQRKQAEEELMRDLCFGGDLDPEHPDCRKILRERRDR